MNISLNKPIIFFDLESTGLNISKDRIVEISLLKVHPDNNKESKTWLINPTIPIPEETTLIHGICNEKVKESPTFKEISETLYKFIGDADLAGYNSNKFDIPMLVEEFLRANIDFDITSRKMIDVQNIFHKLEQRTLTAAYKFYCQKDLINAHSAEADTYATYEILLAQLNKYQELENNVEFLSEYSRKGKKNVDAAGFIRSNHNGEYIINFGKYKDKTLNEIWNSNPGYFSWIKQADFPLHTKNIMNDFVNEIRLKNKFNS